MQITIEKKQTSTEVIEVKTNACYKHCLIDKFAFITQSGDLIEVTNGYIHIWRKGSSHHAKAIIEVLSESKPCVQEEFEAKYNGVLSLLDSLLNPPAESPALDTMNNHIDPKEGAQVDQAALNAAEDLANTVNEPDDETEVGEGQGALVD